MLTADSADALPAPDVEAATIPAGLPHTPCVLRAWVYASALSARYFGLPVYLVGGALRDLDPRDLDVVIPVPDDLFRAMHGDPFGKVDLARWSSGLRSANPPAFWRRWARDCAKQSRVMTLFCGRAVDFKTQPQGHFDTYADQPRIRLDCGLMPEEPSA